MALEDRLEAIEKQLRRIEAALAAELKDYDDEQAKAQKAAQDAAAKEAADEAKQQQQAQSQAQGPESAGTKTKK